MTANNAIFTEIAAAGLPVVFVDTCCILNVVNSLHLRELPEDYSLLAKDLLTINKARISLVACERIEVEWGNNIDEVMNTLEKELIKTDRNTASAYALLNKLLTARYSVTSTLSDLNVYAHARTLSESFLGSCIKLAHTESHNILAMNRMMKNEAPARKGKGEPGDCLIIETFLDMCNKLRMLGFKEPIYFFTANKLDFGSHKKVLPPLDSQFQQYGASLINHINHLMSLVK